MKNKITVIIKQPYRKPEVAEIDNTLKSLQKIVNGYIEAADLPDMDDVYGFCNDEGLLIGMEPNVYRPEWKDVLFGPLVFTGAGIDGECVSLTQGQIDKILSYLKANSAKSFMEAYDYIKTNFQHSEEEAEL